MKYAQIYSHAAKCMNRNKNYNVKERYIFEALDLITKCKIQKVIYKINLVTLDQNGQDACTVAFYFYKNGHRETCYKFHLHRNSRERLKLYWRDTQVAEEAGLES